ncbi:MAG: hypothetical protein WC467_04665 [Patescibacteria group bacterium]
MFKKIILGSALSIIIALSFSLPLVARAQSSIINPNATGVGTTSRPYDNGDYSLNDIMAIAIGASRWILGIIGSLALIMFIYGGFTFLISGGSSEKVGQARKIIIAAVIGLLIVFSSYLIIKFVLASLGLNWQGSTTKMELTSYVFPSSQNKNS